MIGETFFHLRSRLDARLRMLATVLRELGADAESQAIVANLSASLHEPFVFVIVGEVNVGKSTFLNALFGQDFSQTGVMPTTDKILFFKYGTEHRTAPITPTLEEVQVPAPFLRDFHIVDTPGTNSIENEHQEITERFVPISDLVIFVFSAMNPWGASAWQFLDKVHRHWMRNVLFVLQQSDLRTPEEMNVIIDYMKQLVRQRYGRDFPIFPVSAKKAYLARSSGIDRETLLRESGFQQLEAHISEIVERNASRLNKLLSSIQLSRQLLSSVHERISALAAQARRAAEVVREMSTERELQVDRTLKKILPALDATRRDYQESCLHIASLAEEALSTRQAFGKRDEEEDPAAPADDPPGGGNRAQTLDHRLFQHLQHRTGDRWRQVGIILEEDSLQYDRFLRTQGRGSLFPPDEKPPTEADPEIRRIFSAHIDSTIRRFVLSLKLDETIAPGLLAARRRARWVPWLAVPALLGTGAAAYFEGWAGGGIALAAGLLLIGGAFLTTQLALQHARNSLVDRLEQSARALHEMLAEQMRVDVEALFGRFLEILNPAREVATEHEEQMLTQLQRLEELMAEFDDIEREIRAVSA
ncbi:MAG: dynamin family protein [Prosthecobacter sp.]|nr:dynamin family protein [Prosthecobacter sp.]